MASNKKIFPASILEQTSEFKIYELSRPSKAIYLIILSAIICFFIALFFIRINVTVKAGAQIKPMGEKIMVASPASGRINFINIRENKIVHSGDTLAIIQSQRIMAQLPHWKHVRATCINL